MSQRFSSADLALARRIEAADAANALSLMHGTRQANPACGLEAIELLGGCALYGGAGSPMTHLLGGGMKGPVTEAQLNELEEFFRMRQSPCLIDLCPLADPSFIAMIFQRGYRVVELNNILVRTLADFEPAEPSPNIVPVQAEQARDWVRVVSQGFSIDDEPDPVLVELLGTMPHLGVPFLAQVDGEPVGGGSMGFEENLALFYGDATRAAWRGRGLQTALIQARLRHAKTLGADLAVVTVVPGTPSHRNYERAGFQLVYMRVNVARDFPES